MAAFFDKLTSMKSKASKKERWFIIINPAACNGALGKKRSRLVPLLQRHLLSCKIAFTRHEGHAIQLAGQAIKQGYRKIIGVGGDGTNNEVINGIFQQKDVDTGQITYALLPLGTGNDWRKAYGIPRKINNWLEMISNGNITLQDVGKVSYYKNGRQEQRFFANVAGLAYDAFVTRYASKYKSWIVHKIFYHFLVLRCLFKYKLTKARISFDGTTVEDYVYTINAGICKYSGGGMQIVPHAIPDDGYFALTIAKRLTKLDVILNTFRFYNGTIGRHPKIDTFQVKQLRIEAIGEHPTLLETDGEFLGETPVEFEMLEKALKIVVP